MYPQSFLAARNRISLPVNSSVVKFSTSSAGMSNRNSSTTTTSMLTLAVTPKSGLVDEDWEVKVSGLEPYECVTLASCTLNDGKHFGAVGQYVADETGVVDVGVNASAGGTYTGVEKHGLLWSMVPMPTERPGTRLIKKDVTKPIDVQVSVYRDHIRLCDIEVETPLAQTNVERWYLSNSVTRTLVKDGRIRGSFFCPAGVGPYPAVIDMFGIAGGLIEHRAALLAARGIATLSLAYFAYDDLPKRLELVDLSYFVEAVKWLQQHPDVDSSRGIGMIGVSRGAELISKVAEVSPDVTLAILINTFSHSIVVPIHYDGETMPGIPVNNAKAKVPRQEIYRYRRPGAIEIPSDPEHASTYRIEKSKNCHFLFLVSEADLSTTPAVSLNMINRLKACGKNNYEFVLFQGAGHLLEPPHSPHCRYCYSYMTQGVVDYGGETKQHSRAQEKAWAKILHTVHSRLGHPSKL